MLIKIYKFVGGLPYPPDLRRYGQSIKIQLVAISDRSEYVQTPGLSIAVQQHVFSGDTSHKLLLLF